MFNYFSTSFALCQNKLKYNVKNKTEKEILSTLFYPKYLNLNLTYRSYAD